MAAGRFAEEQTILGWVVNTRNLWISLSREKATKIEQLIDKFLEEDEIKMKEVEKLIGKLNRVALIIPGGFHFLYGIREFFFNRKKGIDADREGMENDLRL